MWQDIEERFESSTEVQQRAVKVVLGTREATIPVM